MPTLHELHRHLRDFVLDRADGAPLASLLAPVPAPPPAAERLSIHRNCTQIGLADALADAFPVVRRLVGDDFFAALARAHVRAHPPRAATLLFHGADLARFLRDWPPVASLPWLADVARLESSWTQAYHAAEAPTLDPADLFALPEDMLERLMLPLHPSVRLMASPWPVATIWRANQPGAPERRIHLGQGAERVVIRRPRAEVFIETLSPAAFSFLLALQARQDLGCAWKSALDGDADFDLATELAAMLHRGLFRGYELP